MEKMLSIVAVGLFGLSFASHASDKGRTLESELLLERAVPFERKEIGAGITTFLGSLCETLYGTGGPSFNGLMNEQELGNAVYKELQGASGRFVQGEEFDFSGFADFSSRLRVKVMLQQAAIRLNMHKEQKESARTISEETSIRGK